MDSLSALEVIQDLWDGSAWGGIIDESVTEAIKNVWLQVQWRLVLIILMNNFHYHHGQQQLGQHEFFTSLFADHVFSMTMWAMV